MDVDFLSDKLDAHIAEAEPIDDQIETSRNCDESSSNLFDSIEDEIKNEEKNSIKRKNVYEISL